MSHIIILIIILIIPNKIISSDLYLSTFLDYYYSAKSFFRCNKINYASKYRAKKIRLFNKQLELIQISCFIRRAE